MLLKLNTIRKIRWRRLLLCSLLLPGLLQTYLPICHVQTTQPALAESAAELATRPTVQSHNIMPHCRCSAAKRAAGQCCCARPQPSNQNDLLSLFQTGELCGDIEAVTTLASAEMHENKAGPHVDPAAVPVQLAFSCRCSSERPVWSVAAFKTWCPTTSNQTVLISAMQPLCITEALSPQHQDDPPEPPPPEFCTLSA